MAIGTQGRREHAMGARGARVGVALSVALLLVVAVVPVLSAEVALADEVMSGAWTSPLLVEELVEVDMETELVETQAEAETNLVATLSAAEFARILTARHPILLQMEAEGRTFADVEHETEADADVDVDADADADESAEVEADSDAAVEEEESTFKQLVEVAASGGIGCVAGGQNGNCMSLVQCQGAMRTASGLKSGCNNGLICCLVAAAAKAPTTATPAAKGWAAGLAGGAAGSAGGTAGSAGGTAGSAGGTAGSAGGTAGSAGGTAGSAGGTAGSAGGTAGSAGGTAGSAGGTAGSAGGTAGSAGGTAGSSGGTAGSSGGTAGSSGGTAGSSGGTAGSVGGTAGSSGGTAGHPVVIVQPQMDVSWFFLPQSPPQFATPADRFCYPFYLMALNQNVLSGVPAAERALYAQSPGMFCTKVGATGEWAQVVQSSRVLGTLNTAPWKANWAEAAVGSLEVALMRAGKYKGPLSVQQAIDCVKGPLYPDSNGCKGGTPMDVLMYARGQRLMLDSDYPYVSREGACKASVASTTGAFSHGWQHPAFTKSIAYLMKRDYTPCSTASCSAQANLEIDMFQAVTDQAPFIAYVDATNWQRYQQGVFPTAECQSTMEAGNHIVELIGYGRQGDIPFWLVKNSWGAGWGEGGTIKLAMGYNSCGIMNWLLRAAAVD